MKTRPQNLFLLTLRIAVLVSIMAGHVTAQTFTTLHSFSAELQNAGAIYTNSDGASPYGGSLAISGSTLYGAALNGGPNGNGTVFAVNTDGSGFTTLHSFTKLFGGSSPATATNGDGAYPHGGLILSGTTLYGTASQGGTNGSGTVFAVKTDGSGFTTLHHFAAVVNGVTNSERSTPLGTLMLSGNTL
jgi:uncharacterized repeat protein (TIGR03803 family)